MLEIKNTTKKFGANTALADVSFTIRAGEILALIGPNSSGKTTMVKLIAGLLRADAGIITVSGLDVKLSPRETKAKIGYIPDEPVAWSGMTGEEFLHFSGALWGMSPAERVRRIAELLPVFRLAEIKDEPFETYSRGNKQKFSILGALLHEPKLLLIDEPIVGLDPESAVVAKNEFRKFAKAGGAVLLVTHTLPVAEEIATAIGVLKKGKLMCIGTMKELRGFAGKGDDARLEELYSVLASDASV